MTVDRSIPAAPLGFLVRDDGRSVIVALDHPLAGGQSAGLDDPSGVLTALSAAGADAAILTPGSARLQRRFAPELPWLLTADYYATSADAGTGGDEELHDVLWSAARAVDLGAAGLKCLWIHGQNDAAGHLRSLTRIARLIEEAHRLGVPVMVEAVLWGQRLAPAHERDPRMVADAARMAFELGADLIKVAMPDDTGPLARVAATCPVPIVAMGGPASDPAELFARVRRVLDAGVRGVALGRNVWRSQDVGAMVRALNALVHDDATAEAALRTLRDGAPA